MDVLDPDFPFTQIFLYFFNAISENFDHIDRDVDTWSGILTMLTRFEQTLVELQLNCY